MSLLIMPLVPPFTACVTAVATPPDGSGLARDSVAGLTVHFVTEGQPRDTVRTVIVLRPAPTDDG